MLATFLAKPRRKFIVRYDPRDMSQVYLRDDDGTYWSLPYGDRRLPAVTLREIKAASQRLRAAGRRDLNHRLIFASIEAQRAIVERAEGESKLLRRERERTLRALRRQPRDAGGHSQQGVASDAAEDGPVSPTP